MKRRPWIALGACMLFATCDRTEPGAAVYLRTVALSTSQADSLEEAIALAPFRVKQIATKHAPDGQVRGEVRLVRGADDPAQLDSLVAWLRHQSRIVSADRDSAVVFR